MRTQSKIGKYPEEKSVLFYIRKAQKKKWGGPMTDGEG